MTSKAKPTQPEFVEQIHRIISKNITAKPKAFIDSEGRIKQTVIFDIGNADEDLTKYAKSLGLKPGEVIIPGALEDGAAQ